MGSNGTPMPADMSRIDEGSIVTIGTLEVGEDVSKKLRRKSMDGRKRIVDFIEVCDLLL